MNKNVTTNKKRKLLITAAILTILLCLTACKSTEPAGSLGEMAAAYKNTGSPLL